MAGRLDDGNEDIRITAVSILGGRPDLSSELLSAVATRLDDENEDVRIAAISTLGGRSNPPSELILAVTSRLDAEDGYVWITAVRALRNQLDLSSELLSAVANRLDDEYEYVRITAVETFANRSDISSKLLSAVASRLNDELESVRKAAVNALRGRLVSGVKFVSLDASSRQISCFDWLRLHIENHVGEQFDWSPLPPIHHASAFAGKLTWEVSKKIHPVHHQLIIDSTVVVKCPYFLIHAVFRSMHIVCRHLIKQPYPDRDLSKRQMDQAGWSA